MDFNAFYDAVVQGRVAQVRACLAAGPKFDVNARRHMTTPLQAACIHNHPTIVALLLSHPDTNVNRQVNHGPTPLIEACIRGHVEVVKVLLRDPRVDVNLTYDSNIGPLEASFDSWNLEIVKRLLASDRRVSLGNGGDLFAMDVIAMARQYGNHDAVALLERYKVNPDGVRAELKRELGMREERAADFFAEAVFLCDGLLRVREDAAARRGARFLSILERIPIELQMLVASRAAGGARDVVLTRDSEPAFRRLARFFG